MKKQFLNIKDFVHINLSRGDKSEVLTEDLISAEKRVDLIKQTCANTEKKITSCLQTAGSGVDSLSIEKRLKKMPQMQLYLCFTELAEQLGTDSVLGLTLSECSKLQILSAKELLNNEMETEKQCLNALTKVSEVEIPVVTKARKQLTKATTDMDSFRVKYQTALKLAQQNAGSALSSAQKAESLKKELEDSSIRVDQTRDSFASEMFALLSNESEYANIFLEYFRIQSNFHKKMQELMEVYIPLIERVIKDNPQKPVFGTALEEHLRVTKREVSVVVETCVGWLMHSLSEEGLFRISGSTSKVKKLKNAFDAGIVDIDEYVRDTHTVAGALKSYLRELPEPLFTYSLYHEWISAAKINDIDTRLQALWKVCNKLPKANFDNMRYLVKFLAKLSNNCDSNKMSSQNLAIAISPSLIWPQQESQPFDLNMTAANQHSLILDALINYSDYFFPGELNFVSFPINGERVMNGENSYGYSGDQYSNKSQQIPRPSKKPAPAPPVPQIVKPLERSGSLNGRKSSSDSKNSLDLLETESSPNRESVPTSLEYNNNMSFGENNDSNHSVIYSTASLDRPAKKVTDSSTERQNISDRKVSANIQLRNKVIEKPNVPPPSVPIRNSTERPQSVHERPSNPPPERPQRSCDNKVKQRSLEVLNDSNGVEDRDQSGENESNSKSMYPSLHEFIDSDSNDNSSIDSFKTKTFCEKDCIAFADDSDIEDNNNISNNRYKIDTNYTQRVKQSIPNTTPMKPPRAQSPANSIDKCESNPQSSCDDLLSINKSIANTIVNTNHTVQTNLVVAQPRPPRPLPPNKPKIAASSEDTHL